MEIGAHLHHLQLHSPDPEALARFYARCYGMSAAPCEGGWHCAGPGRDLLIAAGPAKRLGFAAFAFGDSAALAAHRARVETRADLRPNCSSLFDNRGFSVIDPQGNSATFGLAGEESSAVQYPVPAPIRIQHFALRSTLPAELLAFYRDALGFIVSDRVEDETGRVRACFLRTDAEHHALAIFDSTEACHDHLSFETTGWTALRDWADHMGRLREPIVWGVGRHGPGNDVFFMIRDPDGNLAEISAEIEVCAPGRAEGRWPPAQRTLNLWGMGLMRT